MEKMIKGVLIDVKKATVNATEIEDTLHSLYKAIDCDTIDIITRNVGGQVFDIVIDDEGRFNEDNIVSAYDEVEYDNFIVGNIFVCNNDGEGNLTSLTEDEVKLILSNIQYFTFGGRLAKRHPVLTISY